MAKDEIQNRNYNPGGYNHQGQYQQRNNYDNAPAIEIPTDIAYIDADDMVELSEKLGKSFTSIKTNQIRNIYANITLAKINMQKKIELNQILRELILLKPKLAYAAGRQPVVKPFQEYLSKLIDACAKSKEPQKALPNFFDIVEGIVAYHKFHGGKEN